jgi:hypothetical protein
VVRGGDVSGVVLRSVPTDRYREIAEHHDEVVRELKLVIDPQVRPLGPADRLRALVPLLEVPFKPLVRPLRAAVAEARARGEERVDVVVPLQPGDVRGLRALHDLLREADSAAEQGALLSLPLSGAAVALRGWIVEEAERQVLEGLPPRPYAGT